MTDWFEKVPKTEIHLHLEGAIPHSALWELVQKYGGDPSVKTFDELEARFEYRDFPHFLDIWTWKNGFLREYEDFELIAAAVAQDLVGQNIRYVEAFYSPSDFAHHGLQTQKITEAVRAGLNQVSGIEVALIADLVRDYGPERAMETLKEVNEVTEFGIIGIGLGGAEHDYPPVLFQEAYDTARKSGLRTTAHAGEGAGAESVRSAIDDLRVDRIGHGVRAQEDEQLLERLAASQIPLEVCPISNIRTGVVTSLEQHPIRDFHRRGILVTVNTDDPKMFGNTLAEEYRLLEQESGFSRDQIRQLLLNGIEASWMSRDRREELRQRFESDPSWLG
jgi:adenosine deaminase